jgi:hypothetical protein
MNTDNQVSVVVPADGDQEGVSIHQAYLTPSNICVHDQVQPLVGAPPLPGSSQNTKRAKDKGKGPGKRTL